MPRLFDELFPPGVITESGDLVTSITHLMPEEELLIARAVPKRQREFASGRQYARVAMDRLGIHGFPLLSGSQREPLWPEEVVGSISHSDSYCVAAVGLAQHYRGIGIDLEPDEPLNADLVDAICCPDEVLSFSDTPDIAPLVTARILFCAKESVYKCQFPITHTFLDFSDVSVRLDRSGDFRIERCRVDYPCDWVGRMHGRWRRTDGFLVAAAWLLK